MAKNSVNTPDNYVLVQVSRPVPGVETEVDFRDKRILIEKLLAEKRINYEVVLTQPLVGDLGIATTSKSSRKWTTIETELQRRGLGWINTD